MLDTLNQFSTTLLDLPHCYKACVIKIDDWHYILINSRINEIEQKLSFIHELLHIKFDHFSETKYYYRSKNEQEVEHILNALQM